MLQLKKIRRRRMMRILIHLNILTIEKLSFKKKEMLAETLIHINSTEI